MKHIFIINPNAGAVNAYNTIKKELASYDGRLDYEIYETKGSGDATVYVRKYCEKNTGVEIRFYACGGDGTLNEVASGAIGHPYVSVTCYPCGSGNDFVKCYGGAERFLNIADLIDSTEESIDIMRIGDRYCINICNFGFDSSVAKTMAHIKRKKFIGGKNAYTFAVLYSVFHAMKNKCKITVDGKSFHDGNMLLCTIANGKYVGGSYLCAPRSVNNDGLLDICLSRPLSKIRFAMLLGPYKKGNHLDDPKFKKYILYAQGRSVEVDANEGFSISLDGEIVGISHFKIEILNKQLRFAVPKGGI